MNTAVPPSPSSYAGGDWLSGSRGAYPPLNTNVGPVAGPPSAGPFSAGGARIGAGRANLPTPPISGSSNGSTMNGGPPPQGDPGGPGGPYGSMGGGGGGPQPPRTDSRAGRGPPPPGHPSSPQSMGRLSTSSNLSTRDPEAARRRQMMMEDTLAQHFNVLRQYLASDLRRDAAGRSKKARDKLLRLSPIQFHELSTDIYDELRRRQNQHRAPPNAPNFLIPKENFHPKRNQARQKLSTLPETRFRDLATDVFFELESRFPRFSGRPGPNGMGPPSRSGTPSGYRGHNPRQDSVAGSISGDNYGRPPPNTIVPNKSYLVEDDDDGDMDSIYGGRRDTAATNRSFGSGKMIAEYQSKIDDLEAKVTALETQVKEKEDELETQKSSGVSAEDAEELRKSLEDKLSSAQALNRNLQDEIDNMRNDHEQEEDQLRHQIAIANQRGSDADTLKSKHEELVSTHSDLRGSYEDLQQQHDSLQRQLNESSGGGEWRTRCEDLEGENEQLRRSVEDQRRLTKEVRVEAAGFLAEMRTMIEQSSDEHKREEDLNQRNSKLEAELTEWKDRYARAKSQLRASRTASIGLSTQQPAIGQSMRSSNGLIRDVDITKFQLSIDNTLKVARSGEPQEVLETVKDVVSVVRTVIRDAANATDPKAIRARNKLTATINNFITAARNFAQAGGISPVSLLDAAASHLSMAIVELATVVKIRSSAALGEETDDDDEDEVGESLSSAVYQPPQQQQRQAQQPQLVMPPLNNQLHHQEQSNDEDDGEDDYDPTSGYYADTPVTPIEVASVAPTPIESAGELLPSTTYQLPSTTYQAPARAMPSPLAAAAAPARKPVGSAPAPIPAAQPMTNGHDSEPDLKELEYFLDKETSVLIASISSLVGSIRGAAPAAKVFEQLNTIAATSEAILQRSAHDVSSTPVTSLKSEGEPLIDSLRRSVAALQAKVEDGEDVTEGTPEYKKWCQGVPPFAFEVAKVVKSLERKVKAVVSEEADDFS